MDRLQKCFDLKQPDGSALFSASAQSSAKIIAAEDLTVFIGTTEGVAENKVGASPSTVGAS